MKSIFEQQAESYCKRLGYLELKSYKVTVNDKGEIYTYLTTKIPAEHIVIDFTIK